MTINKEMFEKIVAEVKDNALPIFDWDKHLCHNEEIRIKLSGYLAELLIYNPQNARLMTPEIIFAFRAVMAWGIELGRIYGRSELIRELEKDGR